MCIRDRVWIGLDGWIELDRLMEWMEWLDWMDGLDGLEG